MREPYCPLSSVVCNATIHEVEYEGALLPTLLCSLQRYYTCIRWCMREPYYPLSSAVCNATIPTLPLFEIAKSACSPFCYVLHYILFIKFLSAFYHEWVTGQLL